MNEYRPLDRRPIASRNRGWAQATSSWLVRRGVSANAISLSSAVFGIGAGAALVATSSLSGAGLRLTWLAAAALVQLRLLANLFDGMVAIEAGKASPIGELFNEVPDRVSDVAILVALGLVPESSAVLGFSAALLAVFVAYIRAVGGSAGVGQVFDGWMAKPQRMFLVTMLCLFEGFAPTDWNMPLMGTASSWPAAVLALIGIGCAVTAGTRLRTIARRLVERS